MGSVRNLLEGVGRGRMGRVVMGKLAMGVITSVKVVVVIGVIEDTDIRAGLDPRLNQIDVKF